MEAKRFEEIVIVRLEHCRQTLLVKGEEYSRGGDRLWNFKAAGRKRNISSVEALMGMKVKHDVSVDDIVADLEKNVLPSKGTVAEKIGDSIAYMLLLEGVIEERRDQLLGR